MLRSRKFADAAQRLVGDRRASGFSYLVKLSPRMRPTGGKDNVAIGGQSLESGLAVDMQNPFEASKMGSRTFGLSVGRVEINGGRRFRSAPISLLAGINPQPACLCAAASRIEHRNGRIVRKQMVARKYILAQSVVQRFKPPTDVADPVSQDRTAEIDAMAREDLRLAIKRRVVATFGDRHLRQQRRHRQGASDRPFRRRRLGDRPAGSTSVFQARDPHDAKLRRNPVEHRANVLADGVKREAVIRSSISSRISSRGR